VASNQDLISDPFKSLRREMEDVVSRIRSKLAFAKHRSGRAGDRCRETKDAFEVTAELPGVRRKILKSAWTATGW